MRPRLLVIAAVAASAVMTAATAAVAAVDGPDVASYQHPSGASIDWGAVKRSGRTFAIVKATEGTNYTNPYFTGDWAGIRNAGLFRGSYHFARPALPISTAVDQARYYVSRIGTNPMPTDLPPILDLEEAGGLSPAALIMWAQTWLDTVRQLTGKRPMLYTYPYFFRTALANTPAFYRYPLWIADYSGSSSPTTLGWQTWTFWQYTAGATVSGIRGGSVDMSRYNGSPSMLNWFTSNWTNTFPETAPFAPLSVSAAAGDASARVSWMPNDDGGRPVTSYVVTASPGGQTVTVPGTATSATVGGLTNGTTYTFSVQGVSDAGAGQQSAMSNAVTPAIAVTLTAAWTPHWAFWGSSSAVVGRLARRSNGAGLAGKTVYLYTKASTSPTWSQRAVLTTASDGTVRLPIRMSVNTDAYVAFYGGGGYPGAKSPKVVGTATPRITVKQSTASIRLGQTSWLAGSVSPVRAGQRIYRQEYKSGRWVSVAATTVSSTGGYSFPVRGSIRGSYHFRVLLSATASYGLAYSPTVGLRVW